MKQLKNLLALALAMCLVLRLAACGSSGTSNAPADTTGSTEAAAQSAADLKKVLNIATIGETDCLYPMQMTPPTYLVSRVCYDTLVTCALY